MKQTTNSILMIRPVAFRMNEQTSVNNYYQKVLDNLSPTDTSFPFLSKPITKLNSSLLRISFKYTFILILLFHKILVTVTWAL